MKKLLERRNLARSNRLMEKWGYKRDEERPLEAPLAEEEDLEEGTKQGGDVKDPLVKGEKGYSAYGEKGASGGDEEVDDAEDLFEKSLHETIREELKKYLTEGGE